MRGDRDQGQVIEIPLRKQVADLELDQFQPFRIVNQIDFGQDDDDALDFEQLEDGEVLAGLGHDALVGGDDEQGGVNPADAGQHIFDEIAMPGHIDDADRFAIGQVQPGEAQVNGHAAGLLFGEPVRVDAAQFFDKGGFAVVDVPGGPDNAHGLAAAQPPGGLAEIAEGLISRVHDIVFKQHGLITLAIEFGAGALEQPEAFDIALQSGN